jgi:hypothetical protein
VDVVEYSSIKPLLKKSILKDQISILWKILRFFYRTF